jgi:hypothetical protein
MRMTSGGNVGIGTASPATRLSVVGPSGGNAISWTDNANNTGYLSIRGGGVASIGADNNLVFESGGIERMRVWTSSGNVNIGPTPVSDAGFKLDVNGTGRFSGDLVASSNIYSGGSTSLVTSTGVLAQSEVVQIFNGGAASTNIDKIADLILANNMSFTDGVIGRIIGVNNNLTSADKRVGQIAFGLDGATNSGAIGFATMSSGTFATRLTIASTGAATFSSSVTTGGNVFIPNSSGLQARNSANTANRNIILLNSSNQIIIGNEADINRITIGTSASLNGFRMYSAGNIGIGPTTTDFGETFMLATYKSGSNNYLRVQTDNASYDCGGLFTDGTNNVYYGMLRATTGLTGAFSVMTGGTTRLNIASTGAATFTSLGTGTVYSNSGTLTNTNPSDLNLKTNVEPINYGLMEVLKLNPVSFDWKNDKINQGKQYGFIAQEVQKIMPDLVKQGEYLGLDKEAIFTTLVKAIQELKQEIDNLKN